MKRRLLRSEPDVSSSMQPFWDRLEEAAAWCIPRASEQDAALSLRSRTTRPRSLERSYFAAVGDVGRTRNLRLGRHRIPIADPLALGRLLVYFPDAELADGAAEQDGRGFFDVNNAPPWDTWVAFFEDEDSPDSSGANYLIAWVPTALVALASIGIDVNPERCIEWLDDSEVAVRAAIVTGRRGA